MNQKILSFRIDAGDAGTRLDRCLSRLIPDSSRTYLQKLIAGGLVTSGDAALTIPRYPVRAGMEIRVALPEPENSEPAPEPFDFPILYEDEAMLVISKPAGVVVHPAVGNPTGTVVNALLGRYPNLADTLACGSSRPGIVHRLDKDTSGCLVIAKTPDAQYKLCTAFAAGKHRKPTLPSSAAFRTGPRRKSADSSAGIRSTARKWRSSNATASSPSPVTGWKKAAASTAARSVS